MNTAEKIRQFFYDPDRLSYVLMLLLFLAMVWLGFATLLLAALFSYLALNLFQFGHRVSKWLAVALFLALVTGAVYMLVQFARHGVIAFPQIAEKAIPTFIRWAKENNVDLPFTDYETLREGGIGMVTSQMEHFRSFARIAEEAGRQALFTIAGCVAAISLFLNSRFELGRDPNVKPNNLYTLSGERLRVRFQRFFQSFSTVMGAQLLISVINTVLTTIFAVSAHLPYKPVVIGVTFLCGLLPVVGNLISNTIIVGIGFAVSPRMALYALIFLVAIHKLEYFLNSKIIGQRIRNPLWMTLIGLVVGERLMGISGMILAPVILHYIKVEASSFEVTTRPGSAESIKAP